MFPNDHWKKDKGTFYINYITFWGKIYILQIENIDDTEKNVWSLCLFVGLTLISEIFEIYGKLLSIILKKKKESHQHISVVHIQVIEKKDKQ